MTAFPRCPECNGQRVPMNYVGDVVGAVCYCGFARRAEPSTSFEDVYRTQTAEITRLRAEVEALRDANERLNVAVAEAERIVRAYARRNPRHEYKGVIQDPFGAHGWLDRFDAARAAREGRG